MTISDWIPVVLFVLAFIQFVVCSLFAWVLVRIVRHGEEIRALKENLGGLQREVQSNLSNSQDRFDELRADMGKLFEKIDRLSAQVGAVILHRRASDEKPE